jgi:hypothetical protein
MLCFPPGFEKFLEMVLRLPCLALEVVLHGCDMFPIGGDNFLTIVGRDSDVSEVPLLPLLATLGAFPSAFDGGFLWWCSATASDCFHVAKDKGGPYRLLTGGVPSGDVEQLFGGFRLITAKLIYKGVASRARTEH